MNRENVSEPGKTDIPSAPMSVSGQIPTDDERVIYVAPEFVDEAQDILHAAGIASASYRTVQGEPSDAQALARTLAKLNRIPDSDAVTLDKADLRAALRAAATVQGGETR